jgi:shikimate dehydrogenase
MVKDNNERKTRIYGLLGKDIDYSFSRGYFAKKFEREGISDAEYLNFDIPSINEFKNVLAKERLAGLNVTIPYKEQVIPYLDRIDGDAEQIGAVNTIGLTSKGLTGYNTDAYGFEQSLLPLLDNSRGQALVLGTGGASKAVVFVLRKMGFSPIQVSRNPKEDQLHYKELNKETMGNFSIVVNTTPLGTHPNTAVKADIPYQGIRPHQLAYDLIYNPSKTAFLKAFEQRGARIQNGLRMLELQAEKAWAIWQQHPLR